MTSWNDYALTVIVQVSAISGAALMLAVCSFSSPAKRHAVGTLGLILVLGIPLVVFLLPQADWWRPRFSGSPMKLPAPSTRRELPPFVSPEFESLWDESQTPARQEKEPSPSFDRVDQATASFRTDMPLPTPTGENARNRLWQQWVARFAGCIWLAGALVSASLWMWRSRRIRRLARSLNLAADAAHGGDVGLGGASVDFPRIAREVCTVVGLRRLPPIAVSQLMPMPLLLGVWRPMIVIPCDLLRAGAETRLRDVLIHEAAHVARRDAWIHMAQRMAAAVWWWHPGVLALNRVITRSREEVCDNFVISCSDAAQYAQTLLELAEKCAHTGRIAPSLGLLDFRWTLEARIRGLLKPGRETMTRTKRSAVAMIAVLLATVCCVIGGARAIEGDQERIPRPKEAQSPQATAQSAADPESVAKLQKEDTAVAAHADLMDIRGTVVDADGEAVDNADVTLQLQHRINAARVASTRTDEAGRFHLQVQYDRDELFALKINATSAADDQAGSRRILEREVPESGESDIEVKLSALRTIVIGVIDGQLRPVADAHVWVHNTFDRFATIGMTDASGFVSFRLPEAADIFTSAAWKDDYGLDYRSYSRPTARVQPLPRRTGAPDAPMRLFPTDEPEVLMLTGAKSLSVRVLNRAGEPIIGASVHPPSLTKASELGQLPLHFLRDRFSVATDDSGVARFPWLPRWQEAPVEFSVSAPDHAGVSAGDPRGEQPREQDAFDIVLDPLVSVRGRVLGADGKPQDAILVAAYGSGGPGKMFHTSTRTRADGSYELQVAPYHNYLVVVEDKQLAAAPQSGFAVEPDRPVDEINFMLRQPTRIFGTFYDRAGRPASRRSIRLMQLGRESEGEVISDVLAAGEAESADPFAAIDWNWRPTRDLTTVTDDLGQFSLLVGDGVYVVQSVPLADGRRWVEVSQDSEIELQFTPN